ncbi:MAG: hypothetical protein WEC39_02095 [Patescibacteria group bacterium]
MKIFLIFLTALLFLFTSFSSPVWAQGTPSIFQNYTASLASNCSTEEIAGIFCIVGKVINLLLGVIGAVAVALVAYGGIMYMVSGGDEKQLGTAKATITYAILGLLIVLGSIFIVNNILVGITS